MSDGSSRSVFFQTIRFNRYGDYFCLLVLDTVLRVCVSVCVHVSVCVSEYVCETQHCLSQVGNSINFGLFNQLSTKGEAKT